MINITQSPPQNNPAVGPNVWVLSGLVGANRYVLSIEIGASIVGDVLLPGTLVATFKQTPNPSGVGIFSIGEVLQSYLGDGDLSYPIEETYLGPTPGAAILYRIRYGFEIGDQITYEGYSPFKVVFNGYKEQWDVNWPESAKFVKNLVALPDPCEDTYALPSPNRFLRELYNLNNEVQTAPVNINDWHTISWLNYGGQVFNQEPFGGNAEVISNLDKSPTYVKYEFFSNADLTGPIGESIVPLTTANGFPIRPESYTDEWNITNPLLVGTLGSGPRNLQEAGIWPADIVKSYKISLWSGECPAPTAPPQPTPEPTPTPEPLPFIMEIDTRITGAGTFTNTSTFMLSTGGGVGGYNYTVNWGDGIIENVTSFQSQIHTYATPGIYDISILGTFPRIFFNNTNDRNKLLKVKQWGDIQWLDFRSAFWGCNNLQITATDAPNLSYLGGEASDSNQTFNSAFRNCDNPNFATAHNFNVWNMTLATGTGFMFMDSTFNRPINNWNMRNVKEMSFMFANNTAFNQNISSWDTSSTTGMGAMFRNASAFNQNIGTWNTSNVLGMNVMFENAIAFNQNLSSWCVEQIPNPPSGFDTGATAWVLPRPNWGAPC